MVHPLSVHTDRLFSLIKSKGQDLPKSYIIAGIILRLDEHGLIADRDQEPQFCRGYISTTLEHESKYNLVKMFYAVYNTTVVLKRQVPHISLATLAKAERNSQYMMETISSLISSELDDADLEYNSIQTVSTWAKGSDTGSTKVSAKQDPKSALGRVKKNIYSLSNALPVEIDRASIKKVTSLLDLYHSVSTVYRTDMRATLKSIYDQAIAHSQLDMDSTVAKSFQIVIRLLDSDVTPIELDEDVF